MACPPLLGDLATLPGMFSVKTSLGRGRASIELAPRAAKNQTPTRLESLRTRTARAGEVTLHNGVVGQITIAVAIQVAADGAV